MPKPDLSDLLAGTERLSDKQDARDIQEQRLALVEKWRNDPWAYLTGRDVDGRPIVWTKDEADPRAPLKPFPGHLLYVRRLISILRNEQIVMIDKSRQMYVSTTVLQFNDWDSSFHVAVNTVLSKSKEEDAVALLRDKVRYPYSQMPDWVQKLRPLKLKPEKRLDYPATSSSTLAVAQNAAVGEFRGRTVRRGIIDEAAFQDSFEEMLTALLPMASQIVGMSSPNIGSPGANLYLSLLERPD